MALLIHNNMSDDQTTSSPFDDAKIFWDSLVKKVQNAQNKKFIFLLIGRTGVGKSNTINSLMGKSIAEVGHYKPTTMEIVPYESKINSINFTVFDTPGLCDELEEMGNDEKYLGSICSRIREIDSMWFVSRLDDTRVTADEKRGIKLISKAFKPDVWQRAIIVFTYANSVEKERYQEALDTRTKLIRKEISKYASAEVANNIPSVAVDNKNKTTPDGEEWLGELFTKVFLRASERGLLPFLIGMVDSIKPSQNIDKKSFNNPKESNWDLIKDNNFTEETEKLQEPRINLSDRNKQSVKQKIIDAGIIATLVATGASVGSAFGPGGTVIGGAVGAVVGLIAWLWN